MSSEVGRLLGASWDLDSTLIGAAGDGRSRSSLVGDSDEHLQLGRSGHHNSARTGQSFPSGVGAVGAFRCVVPEPACGELNSL